MLRMSRAGMLSSGALAGMLHRGLALGTRCVEVVVSDMRITYTQQDEPGPYPGLGGPLEGRDAVRLGIRQLLILPRGARGPAQHLCTSSVTLPGCRAKRAAECNDAAGSVAPSGAADGAPASVPQDPEGGRAVGWLEAARLSGRLLGSSLAAPAPFSVGAEVTDRHDPQKPLQPTQS